MKYFYGVSEPKFINDEQYAKEKRQAVLDTIKPICEAFGITDYDYIIDYKKGIERLVVEGQAIGCMSNSIGATVMELINYIYLETYGRERGLGAFDKQTKSYLKRYWKK